MRYIAFVWNRESHAQRQSAKVLMGRLLERSPVNEWKQLMHHDGCTFFYAGKRSRAMDCQVLHNNTGVVFGTLFERHLDMNEESAASRPQLRLEESERILASGGRELATGYWGNYVAFLHNSTEGRSWIFRGPLSSISIRALQFEELTIYFSDVRDPLRLGVFSFSFNMRQIATILVRDMPSEQTALNEVAEILPAQAVEWYRGRASRSFYWHPLKFTQKDEEIPTIDEATTALRCVVKSCVQTWASCYDDIVLNLSGGIDSSIVLAALQGTAARVRCLTHYSESHMEDERPLAQIAARRANRQWYEMKRVLDHRYEDALPLAQLTSKPVSLLPQMQFVDTRHIPSDLLSTQAIFSGSGGDEIFFRHWQKYCISDRLYRHGFSRGLIREALSAAIKDGHTVWSILGEACYDAFIPHCIGFSAQAFQHKRLMNKNLLKDLERSGACESLWFRSTRDAPPGKLYHIYLIAQTRSSATGIEAPWKVYAVTPLRSQPLIELALRIPSHFFWLDGRERGLALKAFQNDLPEEILQRKWKGGIVNHHTLLYRKNAQFLQTLLNNSPLIHEGILERDKVQQSFADGLTGKGAHAAEILVAADVAIFLQLWMNSGHLRQRTGSATGQISL